LTINRETSVDGLVSELLYAVT